MADKEIITGVLEVEKSKSYVDKFGNLVLDTHDLTIEQALALQHLNNPELKPQVIGKNQEVGKTSFVDTQVGADTMAKIQAGRNGGGKGPNGGVRTAEGLLPDGEGKNKAADTAHVKAVSDKINAADKPKRAYNKKPKIDSQVNLNSQQANDAHKNLGITIDQVMQDYTREKHVEAVDKLIPEFAKCLRAVSTDPSKITDKMMNEMRDTIIANPERLEMYQKQYLGLQKDVAQKEEQQRVESGKAITGFAKYKGPMGKAAGMVGIMLGQSLLTEMFGHNHHIGAIFSALTMTNLAGMNFGDAIKTAYGVSAMGNIMGGLGGGHSHAQGV
jgi:hypothetical protein